MKKIQLKIHEDNVYKTNKNFFGILHIKFSTVRLKLVQEKWLKSAVCMVDFREKTAVLKEIHAGAGS